MNNLVVTHTQDLESSKECLEIRLIYTESLGCYYVIDKCSRPTIAILMIPFLVLDIMAVLKLWDKVFKIKLLHSKEYIREFLGRKWYEVIISIDRNGGYR